MQVDPTHTNSPYGRGRCWSSIHGLGLADGDTLGEIHVLMQYHPYPPNGDGETDGEGDGETDGDTLGEQQQSSS